VRLWLRKRESLAPQDIKNAVLPLPADTTICYRVWQAGDGGWRYEVGERQPSGSVIVKREPWDEFATYDEAASTASRVAVALANRQLAAKRREATPWRCE
jgi:hypothetical protein